MGENPEDGDDGGSDENPEEEDDDSGEEDSEESEEEIDEVKGQKYPLTGLASKLLPQANAAVDATGSCCRCRAGK